MRGDLTARFEKGGKTMTRTLEDDRSYIAPDGSSFTLPGRSLMFIRNVGHLMTTPAVRLSENVQREAMHPADQFEAFAALVAEGRPIEDKIGRASCRERVCQYV